MEDIILLSKINQTQKENIARSHLQWNLKMSNIRVKWSLPGVGKWSKLGDIGQMAQSCSYAR